jgi:branched-chain amino acid transport system substrate-binding protein
MGAEALLSATFVESVGTAGVGVHLVGPASPVGSAYDAFVSNYEAQYGEAPTLPYHAYAYDAANIVLDAIETVAVQEEDGTLHIGRQALREALYATSGFQGLTGSLTCDEFGDCGAARFKVVRLDDPAAGIEGLAGNVIYTYTPGQ